MSAMDALAQAQRAWQEHERRVDVQQELFNPEDLTKEIRPAKVGSSKRRKYSTTKGAH